MNLIYLLLTIISVLLMVISFYLKMIYQEFKIFNGVFEGDYENEEDLLLDEEIPF